MDALNVSGVVCVAVIGSGIAYFIIRDAFRFGVQGFPVSLAVILIVFFSGLAFAVHRHAGLIVAPTLVTAYLLGRCRARKNAQARNEDHAQHH